MTFEMTPEQKRWQERHDAEQESFYRGLNTFIHFWTTCGDRSCRRARACCGESYACFERNWRPMPEGDKVAVRAAIKALAEGHAPAEAARIAEAEAARFAALIEKFGLSEPASTTTAREYP